MNLSTNYTLEEFVFSDYAARHGIANDPPPAAIERMKIVAACAETLRTYLGGLPLRVTSGFRCEALNIGIGGQPDSAHIYGCAADLVHASLSPYQVMRTIPNSGLLAGHLDQCILEFGRWVHIAIPRPARAQMLIIDSKGTRPWVG